VAKEKQDSEVLIRESKLLDDAIAEIDGTRVKLKRVDSAEAVIQDLLSQQSERVLAEVVLRENAAQIASTFAKIHAPNEFDLVVNGGLTIVRRGGASVDLDEMSSGQRAAYALSLFLAMNERLRTGPKLLLFDDPVAHVDDINTLSLLDHLRDVALSGQRQIFFATADSKIGALFGRKFRFLGERFKQIELARE
jgi:exonuclease SbcC